MEPTKALWDLWRCYGSGMGPVWDGYGSGMERLGKLWNGYGSYGTVREPMEAVWNLGEPLG